MSKTIQQGTSPTINLEGGTSSPLDAHCNPPIHRLPPEILLEVVRNYIQRPMRTRDLVRLTLVCKSWSIIIHDAPLLWTTIDATEGPSAVRKALQTAKDALLDLNFDHNYARMDEEAFFGSVGEKSAQWRTLVVVLEATAWDWIFEKLQEGAPLSLETLHLSDQAEEESISDIVSGFGGNIALPQLKKIFLANIPINLASLQLSGLKSLTIKSIRGTSGTDIINAIRGSPAIESICLESLESLTGIPPLREAFSHPVGNPSIQLASLVHLSLDNIAMPFLKFLLSAITTPRLETLEIDHELPNVSDAHLLLDGLGQQLSALARLTTDAQTFKFSLASFGSYLIRIGGLYLRLCVEDRLSANALEETWDWVFNHLGKPLKDLPAHLYITDWEPQIPALLEWLTHRLTVTKLSIDRYPWYDRAVLLETIIPLFSRPTTSTPGTWLFPQIEVIETNLIQRNGNDGLLEMFQSRHLAEDGNDGVAAPKPFREIWLAFGGKQYHDSPDPINMEFLRKVQEVASDADVYWEKKKVERGR